MRCLFKFFLIAIISLAIAACSSPIGSIKGSSDDGLWVVPTRTQYDRTDQFQRENDLHVFLSQGGSVLPISVDDVKISVIERPNDDDPPSYLVDPEEEGYPFKEAGRKIIVVAYDNLQPAQYSVEVNGLNGNGGNGDSSSQEIKFIWAKE